MNGDEPTTALEAAPSTETAPLPIAPVAAPTQVVDVATLTDAMTQAFRNVIPAAPMTPPPVAKDWIETMSAAEREALQTQFLTDPLNATRYVNDRAQEHARRQLEAEAAPLIMNNARMIVNYYKQRKYSEDAALAKEAEPIFDGMLAGLDIRPLVRMGQAESDRELQMRWDAAAGQVYRRRAAAAPPRPEPLLMGGASGAPSSAGRKIDSDPVLAAMAKTYNFSPDQIKAIEDTM